MAVKCSKRQFDNPDDSKYFKEYAFPLPGIKEAIHTKSLETHTKEMTRGSVFAGRHEIIEDLGKGGMGLGVRSGKEDQLVKRESY